jgi:hypothetical protein
MTEINGTPLEECNANIFCLQETKRESFDLAFIRKFAPERFDKFDYCPSSGASGGILVCWASNYFSAITVEKQPFAIKLTITSVHNLLSWTLVVCMVHVDNRLRITFQLA